MSDSPRIPRARSFVNWPMLLIVAVCVIAIAVIALASSIKPQTAVDASVWKARYEEQSKTVVVLNADVSDLRSQVSDLQTQLALQSVDTSLAP